MDTFIDLIARGVVVVIQIPDQIKNQINVFNK
jgi:hypothetical protein